MFSALKLGRLLATPGALRAFAEAGDVPLPYLLRHAEGDWGADGTRVWIITEADRRSTTVLLPVEY